MLRCLLLLVLMIPGWVVAEPLTAKEIIEKSMQNGTGVDDFTHELKMILVDNEGDTLEREMLVKVLKEKDGTSHSLSIFTAPRRERGISLLTETVKSGPDVQYLYIQNRVKRINSSNRSSSFRGTEFTFEDLSSQKPDDYKFEATGEDSCQQWRCYVLVRTPLIEDSSYSKTKLWIDKEHFRLVKAEFYDHDNKLLKTMTAEDFSLVEGKYWNPKRVVMANQQTGKSTRMVSESLKINTGLKPSEFTELAMRNWR